MNDDDYIEAINLCYCALMLWMIHSYSITRIVASYQIKKITAIMEEVHIYVLKWCIIFAYMHSKP